MIVFVSIGRPDACLRDAVVQARRASPGATVVLVQPRAARFPRRLTRRLQIDVYPFEDLESDARLEAFYAHPDRRSSFRDGFWSHTTGRFFAVRAFMERERVDRVVHLENDVLLFAPIERLVDGPPFAAAGLSAVYESENHAVPGIVHVGSQAAIDALSDFVLGELGSEPADDMHRLGRFRHDRPDLVTDLPTVPSPTNSPPGTTTSLFAQSAPPVVLPEGRWLFDGARFGQFLGGLHPLNKKSDRRLALRRVPTLYRPDGIINPSCTDRADRYAYDVCTSADGLAVPTVVSGGRMFPLATLHLHSKRLREFTSKRLRGSPPFLRTGPLALRR